MQIHELAGQTDAASVNIADNAPESVIREILEAIHDQEPEDHNALEFEPDVYNSTLLDWVGESFENVSWCDDVLFECSGMIEDFFKLIQMAQVRQLEQVAIEVWEWLEEELEDVAEDSDDEN